MPSGLGGYQPDTNDPSSRRADFDLRRRIARLERAGGGGTGINEVQISTMQPSDPNVELWIDSTTDILYSKQGGSWVAIGGGGPPGPPGPTGPPGASYRTLVGGAISATVTHNLGNRDVQVEVYRNTTPYDRIDCDVEHTDANTVVLRFLTAPAIDAYVCNVILGSPGGGGGGAASYVHNQATAATIWTIVHNLGFAPNVSVVDSAGDQVEGDITYLVPNTTVRVTFSAAFAGIAYLS